MKNTIIILLMLIGFSTASAQKKTITGTINDQIGPIPGATVQIKGTQRGVQTDLDGNFSITADADESLIFSFVGMQSKEQIVGNQTNFIICLEEDAVKLEAEILPYYQKTKPKAGIQVITVKDIEPASINEKKKQ